LIGDILQPTHLLFVLVIALLVLGPKRLPEVGRSLGRGLRDFRSAISGEESHEQTISQATADTVPPQPAPATPQPAPAAPQPVTAPAGEPSEPVEPAGSTAAPKPSA
jgi:sec-independent protein translocase protein TatA